MTVLYSIEEIRTCSHIVGMGLSSSLHYMSVVFSYGPFYTNLLRWALCGPDREVNPGPLCLYSQVLRQPTELPGACIEVSIRIILTITFPPFND